MRAREHLGRPIGVLLVLAGLAGPATAGRLDHAEQYRACLTLASRDARGAIESASVWRRAGGGAAAAHCTAVALIALKQYADAAIRLEALAAELPPDSRVNPADILGQAANAWLLAERDDEALRLIDEALVMAPDAPELHVDRARILAHHGQYEAALANLDKALASDPTDDDALAFRASALRRQGRLVDALADATTALEINPDNASARLERGIIRKALGDLEAARGDWRETVARHAGTPAGDAASQYLQSLD